MTTAEEISNCLKSLRTCGICSERCCHPRTLECMHSFCLECLKTCLTDGSIQGTFTCPKCKLKVLPATGTTIDTSYIESLGTSALFTEEESSNSVALPCKEHPGNECTYVVTDTWVPICEVCRRTRQCDCVPIDCSSSIKSRNFVQKELSKSLASTKHDLLDLCQNLSSRERRFLSMKDDMVLGILKYFGDLKSKILDYLSKHEEEVIDKLNNFTVSEMTDIIQNKDQCLSYLDSLSATFSMADRKFDKADDDNALTGYQGLAELKEHLTDYTSKVSTLKETVSDEKEIKFIINTEFEDMLTEGDLINVELLAPSSRSEQVSQERREMPLIESVSTDGGRLISPAVTISPPTATDMTSQDDEEPPPSYLMLFGHGQNQEVYVQEPQPNVSQRPIPTAPTVDEIIEAPTVPRQLTHGISFESQISSASNGNNTFCFRPLVQFTTRLRGNENIPVIGDLCWVNSRVLVVADKRNKCLKVFNTRGSYITHFPLKDEPYGCVIYQDKSLHPSLQNKIAVTFPKVKKISLFYINLDDGCSVTWERDFVTSVGFTCITYHEAKDCFICATTTPFSFPLIEILQIQPGFNLCTVESIRNYNGVAFGYPRYVSVNTEGIIAISDYKTSKVIFLDSLGRYVGTFNGSRSRNLQDPQGIGVFDDLFIVTDTKRNNVFCVDSDLNVIGEMHSHDLLEKTPRFINVSPSQRPLMAIGHGNGTISLYDVWNETQPSAPDGTGYEPPPYIPDRSSYV